MYAFAYGGSQERIRVWRQPSRLRAPLTMLFAVTLLGTPGSVLPQKVAATAEAAADRFVKIIVTGAPGHANTVAHAVESVGGRVLHTLSIVNGVDALVPVSALERIASAAGVRTVTPDVGVHL